MQKVCSNNTNKLSPQELRTLRAVNDNGSNNTNKLSPQELRKSYINNVNVQIIQINLVLKNNRLGSILASPFK